MAATLGKMVGVVGGGQLGDDGKLSFCVAVCLSSVRLSAWLPAWLSARVSVTMSLVGWLAGRPAGWVVVPLAGLLV